MTRFPFVLSALLLIGAAPPTPAPQELVGQFYAAYFALPQKGGVPGAKSLATLQPFLSPALTGKLIDAEKAEQRYAKRTHGEVPPLIEGDLFTSLFEGASRLEKLDCTSSDGAAQCTAALSYDDTATKQSVRWTDEVDLTDAKAGWRIADIAYGGTWEFMHKGRLTDVLNDAIRAADAPLN